MKKELIINSNSNDVDIALLEDGKLVELHKEKGNNKFAVGDIFLGRIKKLMPGLNAAFVDIGHPKDAFLHYTDLTPRLPSLLKFTKEALHNAESTHLLDKYDLSNQIVKTGRIDKVLKRRQPILVQVLKEPISTKGPRLSCEITIPGRYLVLTPFSNAIAISKKIVNNEERNRLQNLINSIRPKNFGVIVRTAAEGRKVAQLHEELRELEDKWIAIHAQLKGAYPPLKLLSELDKTSSLLRDILSDDFSSILVNNRDMLQGVKNYLHNNIPDKEKIVRYHKSNRSLFDDYGITKQIKSSFGKTSTMSSGAYVVIEHTEAMHVIDVNSGPKLATKDQQEAAFAVNLEAAEEIARQLRLRDIGGLIIIDFIDMKNPDHRKLLVKKMREFMKNDTAQHTVLSLSRFGLMQITRQRVRPEVKINTSEVCPTCNGTGKSDASILVTDNIERDLEYIIQNRPKTTLSLQAHPFICAYLTKGYNSIRLRWFFKHSKWIKIREDHNLPLNKYIFYDQHQDEIRLN